MKIDLYHLYRRFHFASLAQPIVLDALKVWARRMGWSANARVCKEAQVDMDSDAEVVGISVYTQTAPAAYRVARRLREKGKIVLLGGPHFRGPSTWAEAKGVCDVVVGSVCEEQWYGLLDDIASGRLGCDNGDRPPYVVDTEAKFAYPEPFLEPLKNRKWNQVVTIPTSVGCPYDCGFCSPYRPGDYAPRDIGTICAEMAGVRGGMVVFCDATFGMDRAHTIRLMERVAPLGKKIAVETTLSRINDPEVLDAMARGGVRWLIVGIESPGGVLHKHGGLDPERDLLDVVRQIHDRGMRIQGNFLCGLDDDGPDVFDGIYARAEGTDLDAVMIGILTPYPHTPTYETLKREGRIIDDNWEHYDCHHVVHRPRRMSVEQLIDGYLDLYRRLGRRKSVFRELREGLRRDGPGWETLVMVGNNLYMRYDERNKRRALGRSPRPRPMREAAP